MTYLIQGRTNDWEVVIGLEVHAQIISDAKLFSGAATSFGAEPNSQVSLVDAGMPGMLPVINDFCIQQADVRVSDLMLKSTSILFLNEKTIFILTYHRGIRYLNIFTPS